MSHPAANTRSIGVCAQLAPLPAHENAVVRIEHSYQPVQGITAGSAAELVRWEGARLSAASHSSFDEDRTADANAATVSSIHRTLDNIPWADARDWVHNPPQILQELRNYRRQGMPILRLINSTQTVVALGFSNHGKPGLYFTRKLPF